jgi:nickel/cobalt transporter (NicO) family protein
LMDEITLPTLLLALAISFVWGAMHAMTPGHGKTIVGAYLVGSRGTVKHAVYLGLTTTITHTLGVFAFGLITLFAAQYIVPEKLFPWLTMFSGLFVVGIGLNLFIDRFKSSGLGAWISRFKTKSSALQPAYSTALAEIHVESPRHKHAYVLANHQGHSHADSHSHSHDIHGHSHTHGHDHHDHTHSDHSHMPPENVTWRNLLALGVSGGLLPCPSALVVLLGAIALNKIGLGLVLVVAFSLGLAGALTVIGLAFIYAGKFFERFPSKGKILNALPAFSALFISLLGLGIVYRALTEIGIV